MDVFGSRRMLLACLTAMLATLGVLGIASAAASASDKPTVTPFGPKGLDQPRGLAFGPDGRLYVGEAGHGGGECVPPPSAPGGGELCVGFTSGISSIDAKDGHRVLSGFISLGEGKEGGGATGIDGISFDNDGGLFAIVTGASDQVPPSPNPFLSKQTIETAKAQLGRLIELRPSRHSRDSGERQRVQDAAYKTVADVGHFDFKWTTEHKELVPEQFPDTNPYGVYAGRTERFVVDAAANTLDEVSQNGTVEVLAFIPSPAKSDAVPTCIDRGRDGAFYIGELTGGGNGPGASVVWRVVEGQAPEVWAKGLTAVTGCGFGPDGGFYATEFSTLGFESFAPGTGALVRVPPHSSTPIPIVSNSAGQKDSPLSFPNGFASRGDAIYVSNWSVAPTATGLGQVLRIEQND